jgi:hypothetical protein
MPEEIESRILRLPGYGIYGWETDEVANTLILSIRQTAGEPSYVCGRCGISVREDPQLDGAADPGPALGDMDRVAAGGGASGLLLPLWRADRTAALRGGQGPRHGAAGGGRVSGL